MPKSFRIASSIAVAAFAAACATVANLDVEQERERDQDSDDSGVTEDAVGRGDPRLDGGAGADAAPDGPIAYAPCACAASEACCVPASGQGACVAPEDSASCSSKAGVLLRCVASDVDNGRACCLASDGRSSFFGSSCRDAGPKLCVANEECDLGAGEICTKTTCRDVAISICTADAGPAPPCTP